MEEPNVNKVLLVTGGGRGIGAATARLAAHRGYSVCVNYKRREDDARRVVAEIEAGGGRALAIQADISVDEDVGENVSTLAIASSVSSPGWSTTPELSSFSHGWKGSTPPGCNGYSRRTCSGRLRARGKPCAECRPNGAALAGQS